MSVVRKILVFTAIAVLALSLVSCDIDDLFGGIGGEGECKHSFGEWVSLSESTCSQAGKQARVCAKCSETEQRDAELKAHTNEAVAGVDATCTEDGLSEGQRCTVCEAVTVEQQTIPAKGHTFENGVCHCGAVEGEGGNEGNTPDEPVVSGELAFELSEDGKSYIVSGIGKYTDGNVVIPSIYKGLPVKGIKAYAFKECETMTSVVIPAGIEVISEGAFYNCTKLERVTVSDGVVSIEDYAFYRCISMLGVELPNSVETIGFRAFIYCRKMTTVKAFGVVSIGEGAFMDCRAMKTVLLSDELESIGKKAFADCTAFNKIAFSGTRSSWDAVEKGQEWDSNAGEYTVICSKDDTVQGETDICEHIIVYDSAIAPTCTATGLGEGSHCEICGEVFEAQSVVASRGHSEHTVPAVSATCTAAGWSEGIYCDVCGIEIKESKPVAATGHKINSDGKCSKCGYEEERSLEVTSVTVDKTLLMANEVVIFSAATNKSESKVTISAAIYLDGTQVASVSGTGKLKYTPVAVGRYDAIVTVSDGKESFTYSLKSCFDVKDYWDITGFKADANEVALGEKLKFTATTAGVLSEVDCTITVYKGGVAYYTVENSTDLEFYPNVVGTYYAVITAEDSFGEIKTLQSGTVTVKAYTGTNPILSVNYGTTLNIDDLDGKSSEAVIVPAGKNITLVWNKLPTDSYYRLDVYVRNNDSDSYDVVYKNYTSNSYTVSSNYLVSGHEYVVLVNRYDSSGKSLGHVNIAFTVGGANSIMLEKRFEVISPIDYGLYAQNDIIVQWTKLNYASKYVLSLEYDCGKSEHILLENIEISNSQNSYSIPKSLLHQGCEHILKVSAYDSLGNELSETIKFNIEGDKNIFELTEPEITNSNLYDGYTNMKTYPKYEDIEITWTKVEAAAYYVLYINSHHASVEDPIIIGADHIESNSFTIPISMLVGGCEYSVEVYACCSEGHIKRSKEKSFRAPYADGTVLDPPIVTSHELSTSADEPTVLVEQALTFKWDIVTAASTYNIYWAEVGYEDEPEYEVKQLTSNTVTIPRDCIYTSSSKGYTDFRLRIVAKDSNKMWVDTYYYIRIVDSSIDAPVLITSTLPTNDEVDLPSFDDDFRITWKAVNGAVSYRVRIFEYYDDDYEEYYTKDGITGTSFEIPIDELYFGGQFKLSIRAYDQYGNSKSTSYYFIVGESDYVGLTVDNWNASYEADHKYTFIETVGAWTARVSASWISVSETSGIGTLKLKISVTENSDNFARTGRITFTNSSGGVAIFSITQAANGASNSGVVQITSPVQGSTVEKDVLNVKWDVKYGFHYFKVILTDMATNRTVYTETNINAKYCRIEKKYLEVGHMYQITVELYYDNTKGAEASIVFKVDGTDNGGDEECDHNYTSVVTAPTCTSNGYTTYTCFCGYSYVGDETSAKGHNYGSYVTTTQPTCTSSGVSTATCSRCGDKKSQSISAKGHSYPSNSNICSVCGYNKGGNVPHTHSYTSVVTAATCTSNGYTTYICLCGYSYVGNEIAAKGHSYGSYAVTTKPTCTSNGVKTATCSSCGDKKTQSVVATGHSYSDYVVTTQATCTKDGVKTSTCSGCSDKKTQLVSAKGHSFVNNVCTGCGAKESSNLFINGVDIGYKLGDYFSTTGKECQCHGRGTCGEATDCTCIEVSLTWQCKAFALWCQEKMYGCNEKSAKTSFSNLANGSVSAGALTVDKLKQIISAVPIGSHIRTNSSAHSMVLISKSSTGFVVAQANGTNNREYTGYYNCRIGTSSYTWQSYVDSSYGKRGIAYVSYFSDEEVETDWVSAYNPNNNKSITPALIEEFLSSYASSGLAKKNCVLNDGDAYLLVDGVKYSLGASNYYSYSNTIAKTNPLCKRETGKQLTPAEIIYYACVENDINVVWILANIQKEQGIIKSVFPNYQTRLNRAAGYMYIDSSGRRHYVDGEKFCGFIGQVIALTNQFRLYYERGMDMEQAYDTYTPASESGNMKFADFYADIYKPYSVWFDQHM